MAGVEFYKPLVANGPRRTACVDEAAYLAAWREHALPLADNLLPMAVMAGLVTDRLAWVFMAGYQSACRHVFPGARIDDWIAYAASEDRKGEPPLPGVTIENGCLNGAKTWVAAARTVQQLAIKVGTGPAARYLLVPRDAPGLTVEPGSRPGFLSDLSQGRAHFANTPLNGTTELNPEQIQQFGLLEPLYIYAAFCGFVMGGTREHDLVVCARDCLDGVEPALRSVGGKLDRYQIEKADARAQDLLVRLSGNRINAAGDWDADQRLIAMYSRGVRRRVQDL